MLTASEARGGVRGKRCRRVEVERPWVAGRDEVGRFIAPATDAAPSARAVGVRGSNKKAKAKGT